MHLDVEIESRAEDIFSQQPVFLGAFDGDAQILERQGIFLANVKIPLMGADGIGADDQSLEYGKRVSLHQRPVHVGSRVTLVAIDHHIFRLPLCLARKFPFHPGWESSAASTPELGVFHLFDHLFGRQLEQRLDQRFAPVIGEVVFNALRGDFPVGPENHPLLMLVKGDIGLMGCFFARVGIRVDQAVDNLFFLYRL